MELEKIREATIEELEARAEEIKEEMESEDADIAALTEEVDAISERKAQIAAAEEERKALAAKIAAGNLGTVIEGRKEEKKMDVKEIRNSKEYIDAYAEFVKTGDDSECRAMLTSTNDTTPNGTGTVAVPDFVYDAVQTAWNKNGITRRVRKAYIKGNLKVQFEIEGDDAVVHAEGTDAPDMEDLTLGIVTIIPASVKKWISISDEAMDLRGEAFLDYIVDEITYRIALKVANLIIAAIEATTASGSATSPAQPEIEIDTVALDTVAQALGYLSDEAVDPVIMMNKATWSAFKAAQYAAGYAVDPFEGLEVEFNNTIKSFAAAGDGETWLIVGDLNGVLANFPNGEEIKISIDEKAKEDLIEVVGREFIGIGVVKPAAFCKVKKSDE